MAQKARIGDILEIPTQKGLAYVQFSHEHVIPPHFGPVIRVLPGFYQGRPEDLQRVVDQDELYCTLFPVRAAVNRDIFQVVGHAAVPSRKRSFPLFRGGNMNPRTGKVEQWWLWDGIKSWKIDKLTKEQLDLPLKEIWNDVALISRLEEGWTPRSAEAFIQAARLNNEDQKKPTVKGIRHFLLFDKKAAAEKAISLAVAAKFKSEIIDNGPGEKIILTVLQGMPLNEEYVEHVKTQLMEIAEKTGGKYDAWETALG